MTNAAHVSRQQAASLLQRASQLIDQRSGWTRDHFARDRHSRPASPSSERAVRFCVGGALLRATHEQFGICFVLPGAGEQPERFQFEPLQQAYRLLGLALASLLLKQSATVREEQLDGESQLMLGPPESAEGAEVREERMSWETFAHALNDDRRIKPGQILTALWVAMIHASVPTPPSPGGGAERYGLAEHAHPNPNKHRDGKRKHRLIVDPITGKVVILIYRWYVEEERGLGEICRLLNADLDRYPPPRPSNRSCSELPPTWHRATVQAILHNPKYTGFNVWNRHNKREGQPAKSHASSGSGARSQLTRRSSAASFLTGYRSSPRRTITERSRAAPARTLAPRQGVRQAAPVRSAAGSLARSAAGASPGASRNAATGTAASSPTLARALPPRSRVTRGLCS